MGEIGIRLNAMQFKKIRDGDRFWYENSYPEEIVKEIKNTSFADVLKRNAGIRN
jgi:peroxidase